MTPNESPAALLPCPFFGSEDVLCERADFSSAYILCNKCLVRGPEALQESDDEETPGEACAREAWNSRASTSPAASESDWFRAFAAPIAELLGCLPSSFADGNQHIIRKASSN